MGEPTALATPLASIAGVADEQDRHTWQPLRYFAIYRLILAGLLAVLAITHQAPPPFGRYAPALFAWTSYGYVAFGLMAGFGVSRRWLPFQTQVYLQIIFDILFLTVLMHASGGIESGLGMLLVVTIAAGSMLTAGHTAGLFASIATLALLCEQSYLLLFAPHEEINYPQTGMLGATLFATAALAHTLARRLRESEALAKQRGIDLANMAQLTDYIIQHMQTGVLVVDPDHRLRLLNQTARQLLGIPATRVTHLSQLGTDLDRQLTEWQRGNLGAAQVMQVADGEHPVLPVFMAIGSSRDAATLIFLEDASVASRQAQQLKLASLGRLTASIAHEVRNPLGAISHASELLAESPQREGGDQRLIQIILDQVRRVNTIIENVLQLGRRDNSETTSFDLIPWVAAFVEEFCQTTGASRSDVATHTAIPSANITFDPSHLHQIMWNLCQNAMRYSPETTSPKVEMTIGEAGDGAVTLDVRDHGPGIAPEALPHIFEPFYTTAPQGTGLGLYIARELAETHYGKLTYQPAAGGGALFRLSFAKP